MPPAQSDLVEAVRRAGVEDRRLLELIRTVPRAGFVPPALVEFAYEDRPLAIPRDQVTTQPSLSAAMIEALNLQDDDRVLEVGTGYGFQTALLAGLCRHVTTIEMWADLADQARSNLRRHGIGNVDVRVGDGSLGVPEAAPFDATLVSAAFTDVPQPLVAQLVEGGRLVQPIGSGGNEMVRLFHKRDRQLQPVRDVIPARFVRFVGREAFPSD